MLKWNSYFIHVQSVSNEHIIYAPTDEESKIGSFSAFVGRVRAPIRRPARQRSRGSAAVAAGPGTGRRRRVVRRRRPPPAAATAAPAAANTVY